jgi:hypothetical protein
MPVESMPSKGTAIAIFKLRVFRDKNTTIAIIEKVVT